MPLMRLHWYTPFVLQCPYIWQEQWLSAESKEVVSANWIVGQSPSQSHGPEKWSQLYWHASSAYDISLRSNVPKPPFLREQWAHPNSTPWNGLSSHCCCFFFQRALHNAVGAQIACPWPCKISPPLFILLFKIDLLYAAKSQFPLDVSFLAGLAIWGHTLFKSDTVLKAKRRCCPQSDEVGKQRKDLENGRLQKSRQCVCAFEAIKKWNQGRAFLLNRMTFWRQFSCHERRQGSCFFKSRFPSLHPLACAYACVPSALGTNTEECEKKWRGRHTSMKC